MQGGQIDRGKNLWRTDIREIRVIRDLGEAILDGGWEMRPRVSMSVVANAANRERESRPGAFVWSLKPRSLISWTAVPALR